MSNHSHSVIGALLGRRSTPATQKTASRDHAARDAALEAHFLEDRAALVDRLWRLAHRELEALEAELDRPERDAETRERHSRSLALVSLALRDLAVFDEGGIVPDLVAEDDPRACPQDPDQFRMAVALELDRLRASRKEAQL